MLSILLPAVAHASTLYSSFPSSSTGWEFKGVDNEAVAFRFTAPAPGYRLTAIDLAVGIWGRGTNEIEVDLLADDGGLPGAEIETWELTGKLNGKKLSVDSVLRPLLAGGAQYWVAVDLEGLRGSDVVWWWSDHGQGWWAYRGSWNGHDPESWIYGNTLQLGDAHGAFAVYGQAAVPEPGSLLLIGTGLIALGALLRRRLQ